MSEHTGQPPESPLGKGAGGVVLSAICRVSKKSLKAYFTSVIFPVRICVHLCPTAEFKR
ncbi:MAG: hypothetical protein JETT_3086 [Candidatus Jettenia ecosi]|uniref:Uncharacterized protein n=1 Tax=Candidatus Jettenia ecosi TaxID=2494326 RepID=A0A533Q7T5_9BACT|nr:MAG: hypothetical protein JETT_3086 [Candidatus Jettenia ecosi]